MFQKMIENMEVENACPKCNQPYKATLKQYKNGDTVKCSGCNSEIELALDDDSLNEALESAKELKDEFNGNMNIEIKF